MWNEKKYRKSVARVRKLRNPQKTSYVTCTKAADLCSSKGSQKNALAVIYERIPKSLIESFFVANCERLKFSESVWKASKEKTNCQKCCEKKKLINLKRKREKPADAEIKCAADSKMWLEKLFIIYLLTLFNSMDGYFLDNQLQRTGRHRRKGV